MLCYANGNRPAVNNGVLYQKHNIEKVGQLLARNGLQLPTPLKLSASDIRIPQKYTDVNKNYAQNTNNNTNSVDEDKYSSTTRTSSICRR